MPPHILLVEDDPAHAELICRAFESRGDGVRLTVATSLAAARAMIREGTPDLVIADVVLPDGKGVELMAQNDAKDRFPVVVMTSHGDEEAAVDTIKAGALHYVVKSVETLADMPRIARGALREWHHLVERERAEAALQASERRYRALYDDTPSMFFTVDRDGTITSVNRFAAEQLGYAVDELKGRSFADLSADGQHDAVRLHLEECFGTVDELRRWESCQERQDGRRIWVRTTARTVRDSRDRLSVLMVCEDMTEAHQLSRKLSYQASHDPLTSLFNRREFEYRLERALQESRDDGAEHALCYLDLDQFKVINDTCGHIAGDMLLRQVAGVLQSRVRMGDTLARLGGDEFGVLINYCRPRDALKVAEALRQSITEFRFVWEDKVFNVGVSIGLVPICEGTASVTSALAAADSACYAAKDRGRNCIHIYHDEDQDLARRHGEMQWVARIHKALEENRFRLSYQRIVPIDDGDGDGEHYEVLLRMIDEDGNVVEPDAFLPAAERYNLISQLDHWVVKTAFDWLVSRPERLERLHICSINLSGDSLANQDFLEFMTRQLMETGIPPAKICFEITETMAITNLARATRFIHAMKDLGCRFALDDFGSGLSSFAYLKNLPVDFLKIDGVFIRDILDDPIDMAVVSSINEIGHVMGKQTIAEFVEDAEILDKLREMGVDYAQGYGVGRPQPISELV